MAPFLTNRGKATLAVALLWLVVGGAMLVAGRADAAWPMLVVSSGILIALVVAFFGAVPMARAVDGELVAATLRAPKDLPALRTGQRVDARLALVNRSGFSVRRLRLEPEVSTALAPVRAIPAIELRPASRAEVPVPIIASRSGRWFIHGFHVSCVDISGLFAVRTYLASPLALTFLPQGLLDRRSAALAPARPLLHERLGVHEVKLRGFGTDLREIRDHQHGDPFKNIAWKATARTGRLMVREFESEIALSATLVVDISSTMRGSVEHGGKLEHAIRLTTNFARAVLRGNDRCGVITFDEKVYGHLPPREGRQHLMQISRHLLGTSNVVDEALTEYDEDEAIQALVHYLMLQRRLDFRRRVPRRRRKGPVAVEDLYDIELLNRWLRGQLDSLDTRQVRDLAEVRTGILGYEDLSLVRRYCHVHGVEIPYRTRLRYGTKEQGLVDAVETILEESRNPQLILIVSDLTGIVDMRRVTRVLRLARHRRHRVAVLAPFTPDYVPRPEDGSRDALLHEVFAIDAARTRRTALHAMREAGVRIVEVRPDDTVAGLFRRARVFG